MRRVSIAAISVLALLLLAASASAAPARQKSPAKCVPGHSRLLAVNTRAQVYKVVNYEGPPEVFGCVYGRRPYFLGRLPENGLGPGDAGGVEHIVLAGSFAAYQYSMFGEVGWRRWIIAVCNLRTGQWVRRVVTGHLEEPNPNP